MNERTRYARPESGGRCHCTELRKASRRISQLYDTALAPSGLKTTQRAILAEIGRSEPTTVGSLADALVMDSGGLAHTLKPLTREKLVTIAVDPQDRRNRLTARFLRIDIATRCSPALITLSFGATILVPGRDAQFAHAAAGRTERYRSFLERI